MRREQNEVEERRIEQLFARLRRRVPLPREHELRAMARAAAAESRPLESAGGSLRSGFRPSRWRRRPRRLRAAALLGVALAVAGGLGVGLGTLIAPPGVAARGPVGLGFLPETSWFVLQTGGHATPDQPALALAANVPFHPEDAARGIRDSSGLPYSTLLQLPPRGVVIIAIFRVRGFEPWLDALYPARTLPLRMGDAMPYIEYGPQVRPDKPLGQYQLRAAVSGHFVDLQFYFGMAHPSPAMITAAQRQLDRLVVASERVTIFARPTVANWTESVTLLGTVDNGRAGEDVTIQAKDCGSQFFRAIAGTTTREGGGWSTQIPLLISTTLRAVWKDAASTQVTVRQRLGVYLDEQASGSGFVVGLNAKRSFWRKQVLVQRRQSGVWTTVKSVTLTETGRAGVLSAAWANFTLAVPKGTLIRAVVPRSQAKPCYLPGVSRTVRT